MSNPLVSICIPTYNGSLYIQKCIESCLVQTEANFEIIICDDCSTDNTIDLVNQFAQKDNRIKVIQNATNLGLVNNWNATLTHASGTYIKWLFQDDWMESNALEEFLKIAHKGYDFIISKRNFILDNNASNEDKEYYFKTIKKLENHFPTSDDGHYFAPKEIAQLATQYIALNFIGEPSLVFYKKSLMSKVGNYDLLFHQICDLEYNLRLASQVGVYVINKPLCSFAIHHHSTTSSNLSQKFFQLRFIETAYYAYKLKHHTQFEELQKLLTFSQKVKLSIYYKYRIHEAKRYLAKHHDITKLQDWQQNYPFLQQSTLDKVLLKPIFMSIDMLKSR